MLNAEQIKSKAKELGAVLCGIGDLKLFEGTDPQRNPLSILPNGKCIIGCAIPVPKENPYRLRTKAMTPVSSEMFPV